MAPQSHGVFETRGNSPLPAHKLLLSLQLKSNYLSTPHFCCSVATRTTWRRRQLLPLELLKPQELLEEPRYLVALNLGHESEVNRIRIGDLASPLACRMCIVRTGLALQQSLNCSGELFFWYQAGGFVSRMAHRKASAVLFEMLFCW